MGFSQNRVSLRMRKIWHWINKIWQKEKGFFRQKCNNSKRIGFFSISIILYTRLCRYLYAANSVCLCEECE